MILAIVLVSDCASISRSPIQNLSLRWGGIFTALRARVLKTSIFLQIWHVYDFALAVFSRGARKRDRIGEGSASAGDEVTASTVVGGLGGRWVVVGPSVEGDLGVGDCGTAMGCAEEEGCKGDEGGGLHVANELASVSCSEGEGKPRR